MRRWLTQVACLIAMGCVPHDPARAVKPSPSPDWVWGRVEHVTDGDTIWVWPQGAREAIKLRLLGLDAPEICQFWGEQSRLALKGMLPTGQWVMVHRQAVDLYGRDLAEVWSKGLNVSAWMILNGHAWADSRHPRWLGLQHQAQLARRGLFAAPAVRPQDFRRWRGGCHGA